MKGLADSPRVAGFSGSRRVRTKGVSWVIAIVCSEWAVCEPSADRMVQHVPELKTGQRPQLEPGAQAARGELPAS